MDGKRGKWGLSALLLALVFGCRTTPPNVKPADQPEVLNRPPQEARFDQPGLPKAAFNQTDPAKRWRDLMTDNNNDVSPAKASFGGPSSPGMMR
jgi:hypothetical protein